MQTLLPTFHLVMVPGKMSFDTRRKLVVHQGLHRAEVCQAGAVHDDGEDSAEVPYGV